MNIFVFGNADLENDSVPIKLLPRLREAFPNLNFIHADPIDNWLRDEENPIIIDTVQGLAQARLFQSLDEFKPTKTSTVHNYDLFLELGLLLKTNKLKSFKLIGLPQDYDTQNVFKQIKTIINQLLDNNFIVN